jgi:hypothetical protein
MKQTPEDALFEVVNVKDAWSEYYERNHEVVDHIADLAGSQERAVLLMLLKANGWLDDILQALNAIYRHLQDEEDGT